MDEDEGDDETEQDDMRRDREPAERVCRHRKKHKLLYE